MNSLDFMLDKKWMFVETAERFLCEVEECM